MKTLRRHLFRLFVPMVLAPLLLCTAWSGIVTWTKGGDASGWGWTELGTRALPEIFHQTGDLLSTRLRYMAEKFSDREEFAVGINELFLVSSGDRILASKRGSHFPAMALIDLAKLSMAGSWAFYTESSRIYFVTRHVLGDRNFYLLRTFDNEYVAWLHILLKAEIGVYQDFEPVASSWKNSDGDIVLPRLSDYAKSELMRDQSQSDIKFKDVVYVKNYQGIIAGDQSWQQVGDSDFRAYLRFLPLKDHLGKRLGYVVIAAPEDAVLVGTKYAIYGSLALFLLLAVLSIYVVKRVASAYSRPITDISNGIYELMQAISVNLPTPANEAPHQSNDRLPQEIIMLDVAFGKLKHLVQVWQDAEAELHHSRKQLVYSAKMSALGEMAGGIAHEINSPLGVIDMRARQLQRLLQAAPPQVDKALEFAQIIETTVDDIACIVRGLKSFSRSADQDPLTPQPLRGILDNTLSLCSERLRNHDIALHIEGDIDELEIEARPAQMAQVLLNLLNNSHDAIVSLPEKWIRIAFEDLGSQVRIILTDSGPGIPPKIADKIMEPFFTTKDVGKGTGLGLSVSKGIIESHRGTLTLDRSCPHTCFIILLPKANGQEQAAVG